jgi:hypothetical protein
LEGEICIGLHVSPDMFRRMKKHLSTARSGRALSDDGKLLKGYVSVIIGKEELQRLILRTGLPSAVFE